MREDRTILHQSSNTRLSSGAYNLCGSEPENWNAVQGTLRIESAEVEKNSFHPRKTIQTYKVIEHQIQKKYHTMPFHLGSSLPRAVITLIETQ